MYDVAVTDLQNVLVIRHRPLESVARRVLSEEQVAGARISVVLLDNQRIHELNRRFLNHDSETDVLSFLLECDEEQAGRPGQIPRGRGKRIEGEVLISTEMATKLALQFGWSPHEEVILYLIHGLLHLVGYDDGTFGEKQLMRSRERAMLRLFDLSPQYADDESLAEESDQPPASPRHAEGSP